MKGQNICKNHGGAAPQARRKAAERILLAQDLAAAKLVELMNDPKVPPGVQRMAAADLLDRGGNVAAHVLAIPGLGGTDKPWEVLFESMLGGSRAESRAQRGVQDREPPKWLTDEIAAAEIVDAEVVDEGENETPPACQACGEQFPAELPDWLDAYPQLCRPCREERGLPDPGRDGRSYPVGAVPQGLSNPASSAHGGRTGVVGSSHPKRNGQWPTADLSGNGLVTMEEALGQLHRGKKAKKLRRQRK
ncbi:hypothetical protein I1A62_37000 [Rhodococcus sp. USK10]|uniref:hypothetical protein n=1 Tax=Rhodococcus sp. USK10 TaxID=2789739 RepID=UPI001C5CD98A|nr:hypothetical protein [Rhodococcus sp. USK10]QYB02735.1 hypothetical protein I1A62_37000 [Rhodococcus sp. USK10]